MLVRIERVVHLPDEKRSVVAGTITLRFSKIRTQAHVWVCFPPPPAGADECRCQLCQSLSLVLNRLALECARVLYFLALASRTPCLCDGCRTEQVASSTPPEKLTSLQASLQAFAKSKDKPEGEATD